MEGTLTSTRTTDPATDPKAAQVRQHFEVTAADFDAIYTGRKSAFGRWLDRRLRADMFERLDGTVREVAKMGAVKVLDVGCGTGVFSVALARAGARFVLGVDFSQPMIDLALKRVAAAGLASRCDFVVGDFRLLELRDPFDCTIAIGVFDYVADPESFLRHVRRVTSRKIIATFPCRWTYRAPIRKVRLGLHGCPVYFFSASRVRRLFAPWAPSRLSIRRIGHIFLVAAEFDQTERGRG